MCWIFPETSEEVFTLWEKNLVCFNCWPFPDSFPCEGLHLNFQWLADLLTSWSILLLELTVAYILWFYTFCRIRGLLTLFMHSDHQTWTYSCVVLSWFTITITITIFLYNLLTSNRSLLFLALFMFSQTIKFIYRGHKLLRPF